MTVWERAVLDTRCGLCGDPIARGDPVRLYVFAWTTRPGLLEKVRCMACAGEPPPSLPEPPVPLPSPAPPRPFVRVSAHTILLDFKQRQAREDKP